MQGAAPSPADFKPGGEPEGFRGSKWGAPYSEFSDLKHYINTKINTRTVKEYNRTGDDLEVSGLTAQQIRYIFSEGKLYGVGIDFNNMKDAQWTALSKALAHQYGEVPELMQDNSPAYVWWGGKSFVRLKRSLGRFRLDIWSRYFIPGPDTDQHAFQRAIELGDMPRLKKMLEAKPALVKAVDDAQNTPLLWSLNCHPAESGDQILEFLISRGADVNAKSKDGTTPLYRAAAFGALPTVKLLVDKGATVDMKAWRGETALLAVGGQHTDVAEYLISKGADVDVRGNNGKTALHDAAQGGATELAKLLISKGADVNVKDNDGWSPLHHAVTLMGNDELVKLLLDNGADINAKESKYGRTPLHVAVSDYREGAIKLLLEKGANANAKDDKGNTPLNYAEGDDLPVIIELLKQHGGTN